LELEESNRELGVVFFYFAILSQDGRGKAKASIACVGRYIRSGAEGISGKYLLRQRA